MTSSLLALTPSFTLRRKIALPSTIVELDPLPPLIEPPSAHGDTLQPPRPKPWADTSETSPARARRKPSILRKSSTASTSASTASAAADMGFLRRSRKAAATTDASFLLLSPSSSSTLASAASSKAITASLSAAAASSSATASSSPLAPAPSLHPVYAPPPMTEFGVPASPSKGASFLPFPAKSQPAASDPPSSADSYHTTFAQPRRDALKLPRLSPPANAVRSPSSSTTSHPSLDDAYTIRSSRGTTFVHSDGDDLDAVEVLEQMSGLKGLGGAREWVHLAHMYDGFGSSGESADSHRSAELDKPRFLQDDNILSVRKAFDTRSIRSWRESRKRPKEKPPAVPTPASMRAGGRPQIVPRLSMSTLPAALELASSAMSMTTRSRRRPATSDSPVREFGAPSFASGSMSPPPIPPRSLSRGLAPKKDRMSVDGRSTAQTPTTSAPPQKPAPTLPLPPLPPIQQRPLPPTPPATRGLATTLKSRVRSRRPATASAALPSVPPIDSSGPGYNTRSATAHILPPTELARIVSRRSSDSSVSSIPDDLSCSPSITYSLSQSLAASPLPLSPTLPRSPLPRSPRPLTLPLPPDSKPTALSPPPRPRGTLAPLTRSTTAPWTPDAEHVAAYTDVPVLGSPPCVRSPEQNTRRRGLSDLHNIVEAAPATAAYTPAADWLSQRPRRGASTPRAAALAHAAAHS
ncbi:hypothetical protein Q5752_005153 [Cryptotrichosporon argae]